MARWRFILILFLFVSGCNSNPFQGRSINQEGVRPGDESVGVPGYALNPSLITVTRNGNQVSITGSRNEVSAAVEGPNPETVRVVIWEISERDRANIESHASNEIRLQSSQQRGLAQPAEDGTFQMQVEFANPQAQLAITLKDFARTDSAHLIQNFEGVEQTIFIGGETETGINPNEPYEVSGCAQLKEDYGVSKDGEYLVDLDGEDPLPPFSLYCADMATNDPKEFLTLARTKTAGFPDSNFSLHKTGGSCSCLEDWRVSYEKVRLNLTDLENIKVVVHDKTFAEGQFNSGPLTSDGEDFTTCAKRSNCHTMHWASWGMAVNCVGPGNTGSQANIDLTGTPFKIKDSQNWHTPQNTSYGYLSGGNYQFGEERKLLDLTGGGWCGGTLPEGDIYSVILDFAL